MFRMQGGIAYAHFVAGRYDEAASWAEKALRENPKWLLVMCNFAASSALAGRLEEAKRTVAGLCKLNPSFRLYDLKELTAFRRTEDLARLEDGLRRAGLPE
jgi:tetratricopeptide (TPR) repeat protein